MCKCKRCGRELTTPESVKRGYGSICYRIIASRDAKKWRLKIRKAINTIKYKKPKKTPVIQEPNQELTNFVSEINFLKCEINMFKRQLREIKTIKTTNNIVNITNTQVNHQDIIIERIRREEEAKEIDPVLRQYKKAFREVVSELKEVLKIRKAKIEEDEIKLSEVKI